MGFNKTWLRGLRYKRFGTVAFNNVYMAINSTKENKAI
jgi:hypothetical protein